MEQRTVVYWGLKRAGLKVQKLEGTWADLMVEYLADWSDIQKVVEMVAQWELHLDLMLGSR
jgi:hypothetical protein